MAPYRHAWLLFTIDVPADWERLEDARGTALIAYEPGRSSSFRPNAVVTAEPVAPDLAADEWHARGLDQLREHLIGFRLLDLELLGTDDRPVCRTLTHHTVEGTAVTMEQWMWFERPRSFSLTASVGTLEYADYRGLFVEMADSFALPPGIGGAP